MVIYISKYRLGSSEYYWLAVETNVNAGNITSSPFFKSKSIEQNSNASVQLLVNKHLEFL